MLNYDKGNLNVTIKEIRNTKMVLRGERDVRHVDPFARLLFRDVAIKQARFRHNGSGITLFRYNTGKTKSIPRASMGLR